MLVRLPRAPVLSGSLRRRTQLFSCTLYMAASSKTPPHQSKGLQKFKTPLPVPGFPGSSPLCHHSENPSDTTSFHSVLKNPESSELANMVNNYAKIVTKLAANLDTKNDANLALPPRFRQVLIESPL
ncbi:hypothetical protein TNCV_1537101 [Trichonephila clavipes]|nr:hypothetical protein TNCV_1537101 [Trichonephila clavipes]